MARVYEINDFAELESLRLPWQALLGQTRGASFFQSLDWLQAYWRHFGQGQRLRVLLAAGNPKPIGILPLVVRSERSRLGAVRYLTYPLDDWGSFYGPIGPNPTATLALGLAHVARTPHDWDAIDLRFVDADGGDAGRTPQAMRVSDFAPSKKAWMPAVLVDLSAGWEAYWGSRKSHFRTNVRSSEKKLLALGKLEYVRYRPAGAAAGDGDPREDLYQACSRVAQRSWQAGSTSGTTLSHPSIGPFLRDVHQVAAHAGALDLNLLYLNGQVAAFSYNYHFQGRVDGLRMGFDPSVARAGVGTVLQYYMLRDSCQRGDRLFDLGAGSLDCKRPWQTRGTQSYAYTYFSPDSRRAQLMRFKRSCDAWLGRGAKAVDLDARR